MSASRTENKTPSHNTYDSLKSWILEDKEKKNFENFKRQVQIKMNIATPYLTITFQLY